MGGRLSTGRVLVGLTAVVLLVGCASGATSSPSSATAVTATSPATAATPTLTPTPMPTPAATPPAAPTPTPAAIAYGPVTVVAGTSDCSSIDSGTVTTGPDGVQHSRGGTVACTDTLNDPRVSGTYTAPWNLDWWGTTDHTSGALVQWGTARLVNAGGTWEGRATGIYSTDRGDIIATWYQGTGGYTGLTYFELGAGRGPWTIGPDLPWQPTDAGEPRRGYGRHASDDSSRRGNDCADPGGDHLRAGDRGQWHRDLPYG